MFFKKVVEFLLYFDVWILLGAFAAVWIFCVANLCHNVYRRQNKKLERCRASVLRSPKFTGVFIGNISPEYRRQWRAFVNSGAERPSLVFEFVPRKNKIIFMPLFLLATMISLAYGALFVWDMSRREYLVFQVAFWLAFVVIMMVIRLVFCQKEKRARQVFGKFVAQLNATDLSGTAKNEKTLSRELQNLAKSDNPDVLEKAGELLRQNGLESRRTVEEQRSVNHALNSLLQAYSRNVGKA